MNIYNFILFYFIFGVMDFKNDKNTDFKNDKNINFFCTTNTWMNIKLLISYKIHDDYY